MMNMSKEVSDKLLWLAAALDVGDVTVDDAVSYLQSWAQRDECSHEVRRDLCPDCTEDGPIAETRREVARLMDAADDTVDYQQPIPEQHRDYLDTEPYTHKHNASCYMLGQRTMSYRTCGRLEGEPE